MKHTHTHTHTHTCVYIYNNYTILNTHTFIYTHTHIYITKDRHKQNPHISYVLANHSSTPAWKISWMGEPGRLQYMGLQRVGHD